MWTALFLLAASPTPMSATPCCLPTLRRAAGTIFLSIACRCETALRNRRAISTTRT
ncbi:hypothetical protein AAT19DRAFT_9346 [Rhodotorula toruloides]|uniref:Uncharacterized protein n=1 Tax=Rhodotorula toruloides TaxID=5286 RepID=A0A2T0A1W7_RHOTO|nr:hypothetical protein AAT19DRAFT_9346 [Rhodotorula toruloides]